jgi:hypothetical protein
VPKRLPRDTPVDTPRVLAPSHHQSLRPLWAVGVETLEAAFEVWQRAVTAHGEAAAEFELQRRQLEARGSLLLGAVQMAGGSAGASAVSADALAQLTQLDAFVDEARSKLEAAKAELDEQARVSTARWTSEVEQARAQVLDRVRRQALADRPTLRLAVRLMPGGRRILHLRRLDGDAAVLAFFVLTGRIPSRYDFLSDDSTETLGLPPAWLYAPQKLECRPLASELVKVLTDQSTVWPVKGALLVPDREGPWVRWAARGPVLEAEVQDADVFRNLLSQAEAERVTGQLLAHKLAGRIELELLAD